MLYPELNQAIVQYVLEQFDAGILPRQILITLHIAGHRDIQLTTIEEYLHQNGRKLSSSDLPHTNVCELSTSRVAMSDTDQFGLNTTHTQKTPTNPRVKQAAHRDWDAKADKFVTNATHHGQHASQIVQTLEQKGYTITETMYRDILRKQAVQKDVLCGNNSVASTPQTQYISPTPMVGLAARHDDSIAKADMLVSNSHPVCQKESHMAKAPVDEGYTAAETNLMGRLNKGVPMDVPTYGWDAQADAFAVAAARMEHSVSDISAQLCKNGYSITTTDVTASLQKQGVWHIV